MHLSRISGASSSQPFTFTSTKLTEKDISTDGLAASQALLLGTFNILNREVHHFVDGDHFGGGHCLYREETAVFLVELAPCVLSKEF